MKHKIEIEIEDIKIMIKYYQSNFIIFNSSRIKDDKFNDRNNILSLLKIRRIMNVLY